ncbi:tetratricopeptide repeat protein [Engelhardtia mirabilis]|uniref:Photosystem I assembly protein Ycf3 n=1 Tax=Engelhardtia mirabilis TaxID=2528011 RepID=A0A518BRM2_9BACT|nr:Photosystem I assembly protein Ycf3 [Planctomycetes bacterium Pla133]QDV03945.1 Photosystem I assembly protein Ycf3 [Planctomycetes bacterium Pla86]
MDFSKHLQKADEAIRRKNFDFAVELYRQLLDVDPDQGEARAGLRSALKKRHDAKPPGRFSKALRGALPLSKAHALFKAKKYMAAARALEDYLKAAPLDEEANLLLGESLELAGHKHSAKAVYEFVAEISPKNAEGLKRAGAMMSATGDHTRALEFYERALQADPRDQDALKARKNLAAEISLTQGNLDTASHSRERLADADQTRVLERQKRLHLSDDELRDELRRLEDRFADNPSDPALMVQMAEMHEKLGDPEAAWDLIDRAKDYRRDDFDLVSRAGDLRSKVLKRQMSAADKDGDATRAAELEAELEAHELEDLRARTALRPGDATLRLGLARRLLRSGDPDGALAELQKAQDDPRLRREVPEVKARCFLAKDFPDLAAKEFQKALEGLKDSEERAKDILYTLGLLAERQGDRETARVWFARVFEVDIGFREVGQKMESLR